MSGGRLPVRFVLKDHQTTVPEDTPPGSVLLTAGVNKADPVSTRKYIHVQYFSNDSETDISSTIERYNIKL